MTTVQRPRKKGCVIWFLAVPLLELGLIILTVEQFGASRAISLLLGTSAVGVVFVGISFFQILRKLKKMKASLARAQREGLSATGGGVDIETEKKRIATEAVKGMAPCFVALILFLIPGFITDALGFWMISPFSQKWWAGMLKGKSLAPQTPKAWPPRSGGGSSFSYTSKR